VKRKREDDEHGSDSDANPVEKPKAAQDQDTKKTKKRKVEIDDSKDSALDERSQSTKAVENDEERRQRKIAQRAAKRERKQARQAKAKEKKEKQKAKKNEVKAGRPSKGHQSADGGRVSSDVEEDDEDLAEAIEMDGATVTNLLEIQPDYQSTASPSEDEGSPILSPQLHSGTSSISSIQPPQVPEPTTKPELKSTLPLPSSLPNTNTQTPKERLEARLSQLRADRKADGPDGRPARNRQELLEQRRKKEEERKAAKKEQRRKEKEEEARKEDEEIERRFSPGGSGSLLASPRSPMIEPTNNFSFGRVAFEDGTQIDPSLSNLLEQRKHKGPADPATALKAAQNKASRLSGLDEPKRATIEQQDMWLNAKRKAHGERVRDDMSLLKKALKRKDVEKRKSEKEWSTRIEGVRFGQEKRQQRREENIQKRKDDKGSKGKKAKVKRPGFEGSFRGRTGGGKGKNKT
jgi:Surfeit locus protein 6